MNALIVLVERAVRPVRATPARKMRMREELLAHLTDVFDEEKARLGDDAASLAEAARRFGEPAALTAELQASLSLGDRAGAVLDWLFGWRPPESAARYTLRLAGLVFFLLVPWFLFGLMVAARGEADPAVGWPPGTTALILRSWGAVLVLGTLNIFLVGWLYYAMRDALHGPPWASRSRARAAGCAALMAFIIPVSLLGLCLATTLDPQALFRAPGWWADAATGIGIGIGVALFSLWAAFWVGPEEIRHTLWSCLDLGDGTAPAER